MGEPKPFNGHRSWNAWNVSLWIANDEWLYNVALGCIARARETRNHTASTRGATLMRIYTPLQLEKQGWKLAAGGRIQPTNEAIAALATRYFLKHLGVPEKTPDGADYNRLCVKLALEGLLEE